MKIILLKTFVVATIIGLFAQLSAAQETNPMGAVKQIADIVASIQHFPTDEDKAVLATISGNDSLPQGVRDMATTVSNIAHAANDEGKEAMARIQANGEAPEGARALAGMIANFNHMLTDEDKASLTKLFP